MRDYDKSVFVFDVTCNFYYYWILYVSCFSIFFISLFFIFEYFEPDLASVISLIFGLLSYLLGLSIAAKFACGKIKIFLNDDFIEFKFLKQIPRQHNHDLKLFLKEITNYRTIYPMNANNTIIFYNNGTELIRITEAVWIFPLFENQFSRFIDSIDDKSRKLKSENLLQRIK
jgi:hypothetical protein